MGAFVVVTAVALQLAQNIVATRFQTRPLQEGGGSVSPGSVWPRFASTDSGSGPVPVPE